MTLKKSFQSSAGFGMLGAISLGAFHLCVWTSQCVGFPVHRGHDRFSAGGLRTFSKQGLGAKTDVMPQLLQNPWRRVDRDIEGNCVLTCADLLDSMCHNVLWVWAFRGSVDQIIEQNSLWVGYA